MSTNSIYREYKVVLGSIESPELTTHLNYINFVRQNTRTLKFVYTNKLSANKSVSDIRFNDRINLIKLTHESLSAEMKQVDALHEYARACSAWIAIKGYYLLYYLETIVFTLITVQNKLNSSHSEVRKFVKELGSNRALTSSYPRFSSVIKHSECEKTGLKGGANLTQLSNDDRYKQIMKKLREYTKEEYKRQRKLGRMTKNDSIAFNNMDISLSDFFYWYRVKSNYRDLEFIAGESAKISELYEFYKLYNQSVLQVADAYIELINKLYVDRTRKQQVLIKI